MADQNIKISSETGVLKKLLVHSPDDGIEQVTPGTAVELLYEDIVHFPKMKKEHKIFTDVLSFFIGKENLLDVQSLLAEALHEENARDYLLGRLTEIDKVDNALMQKLAEFSSVALAEALITGCLGDDTFYHFNPLPNLIFTRDIGVVINDHILVSKAAKKARQRESLLAATIFRYHPLFSESGNKIIEFPDSLNLSIEGGDVMVLGPDHILISSSERTSPEAVARFTETIFDLKLARYVSTVDLPRVRYCMHLDTIFTRISEKYFVGYGPLVMGDKVMPVQHYEDSVRIASFPSLAQMIKELYSESIIIPCGEDIRPYNEREQWTDGCNLFAVKDGVAFTYDRNLRTNKALQKAGFRLLPAKDLLKAVKTESLTPDSVENTIITIPSGELSRARGGPHCMTMPLLRE